MTDMILPPHALTDLQKLRMNITSWCNKHQVAIGVGEMAAGAGLIALGVSTGAIELGNALIGTSTPLINNEALLGTGLGAGLGAWVGYLLGSIGLAACGTAIGIPALVVIAGAAAIFALTGYAAGDVAHNLLTPSLNFGPLLASGSALAVGTYLLIKGGRRLMVTYGNTTDQASELPDTCQGGFRLRPLATKIIARTKAELSGFAAELVTPCSSPAEAALCTASTLTLGAVGGVVGGIAAASSVTLVGSSLLGSALLSMSLISAPVWPVVAGTLAFGWFGYSTMKAAKYLVFGRNEHGE